jgi:hypothetical protein
LSETGSHQKVSALFTDRLWNFTDSAQLPHNEFTVLTNALTLTDAASFPKRFLGPGLYPNPNGDGYVEKLQ